MSKSLRVQEITKCFPRSDKPALERVSISLSDGDIMALVGESGSGKTTLLRIIAGLENPDSGLVEINGEIAWSSETKTLLPEERNIGFVFQDYALFPHLTIKNNILYGLHKLSPKNERLKRFNEILSLTGLENLENRFPHELSGGQQQRVALARALAPKPNFILLDEPFSNLDPVRKDSLRDELRSVVKESKLEQVGSPERVYFHSTSEYTASLFGKVNRIPCQLFKGEGAPNESTDILVRPADLEITKDPSGDVHIVGKVIANNFRGDFHEVTLECKESLPDSENVTNVSIYVGPERKLRLGDTVTVRRLKR